MASEGCQAPWLGEEGDQGPRGEERAESHVVGVRACQDVPQLSEEEGQVNGVGSGGNQSPWECKASGPGLLAPCGLWWVS